MNFRRDESGNVLVIVALCATVMLGFAGMGLDVGLLYRTRQKVQSAADAGAIAAAISTLYGGSTANAQSAAYAATAENGYTNGALIGGQAISVTLSTVSFNGASGYSQVVVNAPNPTNFMKLFGFNPVWVSATGVAGPALIGTDCGNLNNPGTDWTFGGSNYIKANCGFTVNSTSNKAVVIKDCGGAGKTSYTYLNIVGDISQHGGCNYPVVTGAPQGTNPWGSNSLTGPSIPSSCTSTFPASGTGAITITGSNVATYSGGPASGVVCFTSPVTLGGGAGDTFTMPGSAGGVVYVFENGVTIAGNSNVTFGTGTCNSSGTTCSTSLGAMMEITCPVSGSCSSAFNTPGAASTLSIYAPTVGTSYLNGIAILQPPADTNQLNLVFGSTSTLNLDGYIYAPTAALNMQDQGGGVLATGMVLGSITPGSNSSITIHSYDQANTGTTLNRAVALVE